MSEDLLNVMGSFSETALDCIEKQNEEIEQLQQENSQLKMRIEKVIEYYEIIDNRNTYVEISELRHLINLLKGDKE